LYEKRERVRKKDQDEAPAAKGKKAPPAKDDKKKGKGAEKEDKPKVPVPVPEEEPQLQLPEPDQHVNANIVEFLQHFKSQRLITLCDNESEVRVRSAEEKKQEAEAKTKQREEEKQFYESVLAEREEQKERREAFKKDTQAEIAAERSNYKESLGKSLDERNKYREKIIVRAEKLRALTDLLGQEKIDLNALQAAVDAATENKVRQEVIDRGTKQLTWLRYCKDIEGQLAQAVQEKVKENLLAIMERIEREGIVIEPKALTDAKNVLSKLK
jgi:hypothetical protein